MMIDIDSDHSFYSSVFKETQILFKQFCSITYTDVR